MRIYRIVSVAALCLLFASSASARYRDYLACYKGGSEADPGAIKLNDFIGATQPGSDHNYLVGKAKDFCVSSKSETDTVLDPNTPWVLYSVRAASGQCSTHPLVSCKIATDCPMGDTCTPYTRFSGKDARNQSVRVHDNDFDLRLNFSKELGVLAPSKFGPDGPITGKNDFFKCYSVKPTKASCVGGTNAGAACKDTSACTGGGACTANPKGLSDKCIGGPNAGDNCSTDADCGLLGFCRTARIAVDDSLTNPTTQQYGKVKMVCQAGDKNEDGVVHEGAALMCYSTKQIIGPSFSAPEPIQATNDLASANYELKKRDFFCNPACIGDNVGPAVFTDHVLKATSLQIGINGQPGNGFDVDNDPNTCSPMGSCSNGIDNGLAPLGGLANSSLFDAVNHGTINLMFELSDFADGNQQVAGYIGSGDPTGCSDDVGADPNDPNHPIAENDPDQICEYDVLAAGLEPGDLCRMQSLITLPVEVSGSTLVPNATAAGDGGEGSTFVIVLALGGFELRLAIQNVKITFDLTHTGSQVTGGSGVLGGGLPLQALVAAVSQVDGSCQGGVDNGDICHSDDDCDSDDCELALGQSPEEIAPYISTLVVADIDLDGHKNCQPGTVGINNFQECVTNATCPDTAQDCSAPDSVSLALKFNLIDAQIDEVAP